MIASPTAFEQRKQFLIDMLRELTLLETDLELAARGARPLYVIDFAAIFAYSYKTIEESASATWPAEPPERVFARRQIALQLVFADTKRLLLIPPYAAELRNHVKAVSVKVHLADLDTKAMFATKLQVLISESREFLEFIDSARSGEVMPETLRQTALEVGKKFFPELYAVLDARTTTGLQRMSKLFESGVLQDPDPVIPELRHFSYDYAAGRTDHWYKKLIRIRGKHRAYQTFVDALACSYLEKANDLVNKDGRFVLFVAPSLNVRSLLQAATFVSMPNMEPFTCVRDLDYFLLAVSHKDDLSAVRESARSVGSLLATLEANKDDEAGAKGGMRLAEDAEEHWRSAENYLLMGSTKLLDELMAAPTDATPDEEFLSLLRELYAAAQSTGEQIERAGLQIIDALRTEIFNISKWVPVQALGASFLPLAINMRAEGARVEFPGLQDEAPVILRFLDPVVLTLATRLVDVAENVSRDALLKLRQMVLGAAEERDAHGEHFLLAGYMLAVEGKPDAALRELARGIDVAAAVERSELFYLMGMIRRRLFEPDRAIDALSVALNARPTDERYLLESAKAYWLKSYFDRPRDPSASQRWLAQAYDLIERAVDSGRISSHDPFFIAQLHNVRAFVSCERALYGVADPAKELQRAELSLAKIVELVPESKWIGRFYDTRAWLSFVGVATTTMAFAERRATLAKALADVETALRLETTVTSRKRLLQQHRMSIQAALSSNIS